MHPVTIDVAATDGAARAASRTTARAPTARRASCRSAPAAVKYLSAADYEALGVEIVLGNTYHLMLRPGADVVAALGGLGAFAGWDGLTLTDSGGFQVFSLEPKVDDDGVTFRSRVRRLDPPVHARSRRSPPRSCSAPTSRWSSTCARRCRARPTSSRSPSSAPPRGPRGPRRPPARRQSLFGIVQGGIDEVLRPRARAHRRARLRRLRHRRAVGRGDPRRDAPALAAAIAHLPADRPRYLMGVGDPASLVEAVAAGVDQFDCVMQTRLGRHGTGAHQRPARCRSRPPATPTRTSPSTPTARATSAPATAAATCGTCSPSASRPRRACSACTTWPGRCSLMDGMRGAIAAGTLADRLRRRGAGGLGADGRSVRIHPSSVGSSPPVRTTRADGTERMHVLTILAAEDDGGTAAAPA